MCPSVYNGQMSDMNNSGEKKLKDTYKNPLKDTSFVLSPVVPPWLDHSGSYSKVHKLITALYMVTDIIDKEEPIRNKLRILGIEIISDMYSISENRAGRVEPANACNKISETVSFLHIALTMNFISEMNCTILKKEFLELRISIQESIDVKPTWLADFFKEEFSPVLNPLSSGLDPAQGAEKMNINSKGHTHIGVQKGSTLMKALKKIEGMNSVSNATGNQKSNSLSVTSRAQDFDVLKKERRDGITLTISNNGGSATITDIKNNLQGSLTSCSEKTLQRELMSMTKDGVLNKTGEKRWSRYFLKT